MYRLSVDNDIVSKLEMRDLIIVYVVQEDENWNGCIRWKMALRLKGEPRCLRTSCALDLQNIHLKHV